jgi:hypothetical protein
LSPSPHHHSGDLFLLKKISDNFPYQKILAKPCKGKILGKTFMAEKIRKCMPGYIYYNYTEASGGSFMGF